MQLFSGFFFGSLISLARKKQVSAMFLNPSAQSDFCITISRRHVHVVHSMIQSKSDERVLLLRVDWINEDCAPQGYQRALVTCPSQFSLLHAVHPDQSLTAILIKFLRSKAR
jgi:hypothetical protein